MNDETFFKIRNARRNVIDAKVNEELLTDVLADIPDDLSEAEVCDHLFHDHRLAGAVELMIEYGFDIRGEIQKTLGLVEKNRKKLEEEYERL